MTSSQIDNIIIIILAKILLSWSQSNFYVCDSYDTCTITCDLNGDGGKVKCNDYLGFDATSGPYFNLLCPTNESCENLEIKCPGKYYNETANGHCNVTCIADNSCSNIKILSNLDTNLVTELNCYGNDNQNHDICNNISVNMNNDPQNRHYFLQKSSMFTAVSINCISYDKYNHTQQRICSSINVIEQSSSSNSSSLDGSLLSFNCMEKIQCIDITITTFQIQNVNISITELSSMEKSKIKVQNNLNLYLSQSHLFSTSIYDENPTRSSRDDISVNIIANTKSFIESSEFYISNVGKVVLSSFDINNDQISSQLKDTVLQISNTTHNVNTFNIINMNIIDNNTINAKYVDNFYLKCNNKYCAQMADKKTLDITSAYNVTFDITNNGILSISNIDASESKGIVNVTIDKDAILEDSYIDVKNAGTVLISIYGKTNATNTIYAIQAKMFRLSCINDKSCYDDLKLYIPPKAVTNNQKNAFIDCIGFGCYQLKLFTINSPSSDIEFNATNCSCSDDNINLCLNEWELNCDGTKYDQSAILKNATSCISTDNKQDNNLCCDNLIEDIHEKYQCPWTSNITYTCIENKDCIVNCTDIQQQTPESHFSCSNKNAKIDATKSNSLTVICDKDDGSCKNDMQILCPQERGNCIINCTYRDSCRYTKINTQKTNELDLNCIVPGSCYKLTLNNDDGNNAVKMNCVGCDEFIFYGMDHANLIQLNCIKGGGNESCIGLKIDAIYSQRFNVIIDGVLNNSYFNVSHAKNVTINVNDNGIIDKTTIDSNYSDTVKININDENGEIKNTLIHSVNVGTLIELTCFGTTEVKGCRNVTLYGTESVHINKNESIIKTKINCIGSYGCNDMNIYTINPVTNDINFNISQCSCDIMKGKGCNNMMNLHCGRSKYNKYSNFSQGPYICNGDCCGDIIQEFQHVDCAKYCSSGYPCFVNCSDNICASKTKINAADSTSLQLSCIDNPCSEMNVICPKYDNCNISCNGSGTCYQLHINTNSVNNMNLTCYSDEAQGTPCYQSRFNISNTYYLNDDDDDKPLNVTIVCAKGICQDITITNYTELDENKKVNIQLMINGIMENFTGDKNKYFDYKISGNGNLNESKINVSNSIFIDSLLTVYGTTLFSPIYSLNIKTESRLFKANTIYCSLNENEFQFSGNSLIENNKIIFPSKINNPEQTIKIKCITGCKFLSNEIIADDISNDNKDIKLDLQCYDESIINSTFINGDNLQYSLLLSGECLILNNNISSKNSKSVSITSSDQTEINNLQINSFNADNIYLEFNGKVNNSFINGSNSSNYIISCGDTASIKDTKCNNLSISVRGRNEKLNKTYSSLTCYKYGCQYLNLYTMNGADDLNISGINCDCKEDITTACIKQWDIYCNKSNKKSIFYSAKNCTGPCCENVVDRLHIDKCKWNDDNNSKITHDDIIYMISACFAVILCVAGLIGVLCWRRKRIEASNDRYLAQHRNFE